VIQLQFTVTPESWIGSLCAKDFAAIRILSVKVDVSKQYVTHFVEITSEKTSAEDLTKELKSSTTSLDTTLNYRTICHLSGFREGKSDLQIKWILSNCLIMGVLSVRFCQSRTVSVKVSVTTVASVRSDFATQSRVIN
jgi:hypothetical protein